jgi:altronate dehydratase
LFPIFWKKPLEQMTDELLEYVISLCTGKKTKAEMQGRHDGEIYRGYQVPDRVISHEAGCFPDIR